MSSLSIFSDHGWDCVYRIRAAINRGDADDFGSLSEALDHETAVQVTMIGETLLRQALGNDPSSTILEGAAAVLTPHLQKFLGAPTLRSGHAADLIRTGLRLQKCPSWASRAQTMMFFCGFLAPVDDAVFLEFRLHTEPLWREAVEAM